MKQWLQLVLLRGIPLLEATGAHLAFNIMIRRIILVLLSLIFFSSRAGAQHTYWSSDSSSPSNVTWAAFGGTAPPLEIAPYDAKCSTHLHFLPFNWDPSSRTLIVKVRAAVIWGESWYRPDVATPALLNHERGHFDLAELSARQLRQRIEESTELKDLLRRCDVTEAEIEALLMLYHDDQLMEFQFRHESYDDDTSHGKLLSKQNEHEANVSSELSSWSTSADPIVTVTVANEGAKPIPGDYEGTLTYTLQAGPNSTVFTPWNWTLQGRWRFSFSADATGGVASWSHELLDNQYGGLLLDVTTPSVPSLSGIAVTVEDGIMGEHFWMNFAAAAPGSMPGHVLTFKPVPVPVGIPITPSPTDISFTNGAAIALGHWMKEHGRPDLKMKAPITCPQEVIHYLFDIENGQFLEMDWVLTRISHAQGGNPTGGAGGHGSGGTTLPISNISFDSDTGVVAIRWSAAAAGISYIVEASEDLIHWSEVGEVESTSAGVVSFHHDEAQVPSGARFFRVFQSTL